MTEKIIKMWNEGTSLGTIAKKLSMTVETASWLLVKAMVWGLEENTFRNTKTNKQ